MSGKVLITGASGFVGFHLIEAALEAGLEVTAAVRASSITEQLKHLKINFTAIDFSDKESIRKNFEENKYDYVIHAAGLTKARSLEEYNNVNAQYTINLAAIAASFGIKKFVFLSSLASVGPVKYNDEIGVAENGKPNPVTEYGKSKLLAETMLEKIENLPIITLRPTAVYGPREKDIFILFKTLKSGLEPYIGRTNQWLSFVYVKDLARLAVNALAAETKKGAYNITDGKAYGRYELAAISKRILNKKTLKFHVPMSLVKIIAGVLEKMSSANKPPTLSKEKLNELAAENWNCNISRAVKDLGYQPKYDLEKGLQETLKWYKENKWL